MMVSMPLVLVWIGHFCRDVIGRQNVKVVATTPQIVETPVTNNSLSKDYSHPDDHAKKQQQVYTLDLV